MSFADDFDMAFTIKRNMEPIIKQNIPFTMLTDSRSLFENLTKSPTTREKRLMIDLLTVKDAYQSFEVYDVAFIRPKHNIADAHTKVKGHSALHHALSTSYFVIRLSSRLLEEENIQERSNDKERGNVEV